MVLSTLVWPRGPQSATAQQRVLLRFPDRKSVGNATTHHCPISGCLVDSYLFGLNFADPQIFPSTSSSVGSWGRPISLRSSKIYHRSKADYHIGSLIHHRRCTIFDNGQCSPLLPKDESHQSTTARLLLGGPTESFIWISSIPIHHCTYASILAIMNLISQKLLSKYVTSTASLASWRVIMAENCHLRPCVFGSLDSSRLCPISRISR